MAFYEHESWRRALVYFSKFIVRDIISKTVLKVKNIWKTQNQRYVAIFSDKTFSKHLDFVNECSMYEYDCFKNVFSNINHK